MEPSPLLRLAISNPIPSRPLGVPSCCGNSAVGAVVSAAKLWLTPLAHVKSFATIADFESVAVGNCLSKLQPQATERLSRKVKPRIEILPDEVWCDGRHAEPSP